MLVPAALEHQIIAENAPRIKARMVLELANGPTTPEADDILLDNHALVVPEIFLQSMIMGRVFDRFPRLRFGLIECSAEWVGFAGERMDSWVDFMHKVGVKYDTKPSDVLRRNVRITPFWHEDLKKIIDRYGLEECWVFSTDFPHLEGSKDPIGKFRRHLAKLPEAYARDFFIKNNELLFPQL